MATFAASSLYAGTLRYESVHFKDSSAWVPANRTCIHRGYIHKKRGNTVKVCVDNQGGNGCKLVNKKLIPQPVVDIFYRKKCSNSSESSCKLVPYKLDQSRKKVYRVSGGDSGAETFAGYYQIPAC